MASTTDPSPPPRPSSPTTTTTTTTTPPALPPHHAFPPLYTLQPNPTTVTAQLRLWSRIITTYCATRRQFKLSLPAALDTALFRNEAIGRRLSLKDAGVVLAAMVEEGSAEAVGGGGGRKGGKDAGDGGGEGEWWVWWRSVGEWSSLVREWVDRTGMKNTVLTLYELTEGDATIGTELHGLPPDVLRKALDVLVKRKEAQVFGSEEGGWGVKFS
ncbi:MAG: hypothetical protein M1833_007176 [Piccolia ochrophora]|nr:MAG: hypothetical protein M1833_007176 [Piccolia ochrophora]